MRCFDPRRLIAIPLAFSAAAGAVGQGLPELGPDGPVACFGRVYDAGHMTTHPEQKIQRIFVFRGPDPVSRPNEQPPPSQSSSYSVFLATTVRGAVTPK
jgi:hypothetical protein